MIKLINVLTFFLVLFIAVKLFQFNAELKYSTLEKIAQDDSKFLSTYINNMNLTCRDERYRVRGDYFDEVIKEIKLNPFIAEYKALGFRGGYIEDKDLPYLLNLLDSFECTRELDLSLNYINTQGVKHLCSLDLHNIKKIDLSQNLFGYKTDELISLLSPCNFRIIHKSEDNSLILEK